MTQTILGHGTLMKHRQEDIRTNGDCCFNHIIELPYNREDNNLGYLITQIKLVTQPLSLLFAKGRLNENVAPLLSLLFSAHIFPP